MNRQELFGTRIISHETPVDTSYLPFIKSNRRSLYDVNYPQFFSGWPYFILVLATLLMGTTKVSSQGLLENEEPFSGVQQVISGLESFSKNTNFYHRKTGELTERNRCEAYPGPKRGLASTDFSASLFCTKDSTIKNTF